MKREPDTDKKYRELGDTVDGTEDLEKGVILGERGTVAGIHTYPEDSLALLPIYDVVNGKNREEYGYYIGGITLGGTDSLEDQEGEGKVRLPSTQRASSLGYFI